MAAVYPFQYASFPTYHDQTDIVWAKDVNNIQTEVAAIQQTLGIAPHQDTGLTMQTNKWASIGARLDAIQRGKGVPAIQLFRDAWSWKSVAHSAGGNVPFGAPYYDPEHLYNGHSITANRTGWWIISGSTIWTSGSASGDRQLSISIRNSIITSQDNTPSPDGWTSQAVTWQGPINKGDTLDLLVYHPLLNQTLSLSRIWFAACMVREL